MKKIIIFGGSFNPPLYSHLSFAEQILNEIENIQKILFLPVNSKYEKPGLASNEDRYNMLKIACSNNEKFEVSREEIDKEKQLLTVETLRIIQNKYPQNEIYFVMGTDNLKEVEEWELGEELISEFKMLIIERDKDSFDEILKSSLFLQKYKNSFIKLNTTLKNNMSSTFVRNKLKEGKEVKYLLPDEVIKYIREKNLYK